MNTKLLAFPIVLVLAAAGVIAAENKATEEENAILALVLKQSYADGGYTVVRPETDLSGVDSDYPRAIKQSKTDIAENLATNGVVVAKLVDRLFERNKKPVLLTVKSSPKDGYLIDYDGKYKKYFEKDGGGWARWYQENPKAHGYTTVTLPVYDKKTGLVLVYKGTQSHGRAGAGWVILYRYENGELKELNKVMMWIS